MAESCGIEQKDNDLPFQRVQRQFAAHLRDPEANPGPAEIEDRRLAIYRDLFFNNVEGFLKQAYPVLRQLYNDEDWLAMARRFFARHASEGPQFYQIAQEFLLYLQNEHAPVAADPPFLLELAHYEWVELILAISDADTRIASGVDPNGDLLAGIPVPSPVMMNLAYTYPVHQIGPKFQPKEPAATPTYLVVHRDRNDKVRFLQVNALTSRLLQLMQEKPHATGRQLLQAIAVEMPGLTEEAIVQGGQQTLQNLRQRDILLGTR